MKYSCGKFCKDITFQISLLYSFINRSKRYFHHIIKQITPIRIYLCYSILFETTVITNYYKRSVEFCLHIQIILFFILGSKYETELVDTEYKVQMKLTIKSVNLADYGSYNCVSKNSLGETDGTIKLYRKFHKCFSSGILFDRI